MMRLLTSFIPILVLSTATANLLAEGPQNPIRILPAAFPISDNHGVPATPAARLQRIADAKPATHTTPPLVGRELNQFLRRQNPQDPLGWKNPSTCNVGVCDTGLTCSVWDGNGALTNPATGICCASTTVCPDYTACAPWGSHSVPASSFTGDALYLMYSRSTIFCGSIYSLCYTGTIDYAYGLGRMVFKRCASEMATNSVSTNGNWALYASKSVFDPDDKGPKPASVFRPGGTSISLPVPTPTTDVPTTPVVPGYTKEPDSSDKLSAGAIAGIVIGGVAAVGIFVVLAIWLILRHRRKTRGTAAVPAAGAGPHTPGTDAHHWEAPPVQTGSGYAPVPPNPPMSDSGNSHGWNQTASVGGSGGSPSDYRGSVLYPPPPSSPGPTNMGQYGQMPTEAYQPAEPSKVGPMEGTTYVEVPGSMPPMSQYQQTTPPGMYGQPPPPPPPPASELDAQQNHRQY